MRTRHWSYYYHEPARSGSPPSMIHILREFWRGLRSWERPARLALALGLLAMFPLLLLWLAGPPALRPAGLAGLCGLGLGLQLVFLWAWRGMLSDWTRAQRFYLDGEFEAACELLQARRATGRADMRSLTLLGNALRQRGLLEAERKRYCARPWCSGRDTPSPRPDWGGRCWPRDATVLPSMRWTMRWRLALRP